MLFILTVWTPTFIMMIQFCFSYENQYSSHIYGFPYSILFNFSARYTRLHHITLRIIHWRSIDEGVIPEIFKLAYITPLHKWRLKMNPANYTHISLTSHIMKNFAESVESAHGRAYGEV